MVVYALLVLAGFLFLAYASVHRGDSRSPSIGAPAPSLGTRPAAPYRLDLHIRRPHRPERNDPPL